MINNVLLMRVCMCMRVYACIRVYATFYKCFCNLAVPGPSFILNLFQK